MSIVEKALQKLQSARDATIAQEVERPIVVGTVVQPAGPGRPVEVPRHQPAPPPQPSRFVHVDRELLRRAGLMPPESQERELAHQYRSIKRPLIAHAMEPVQPGSPPGRLIMMASALPGEGKTFTSINLALSLSLEKDHSVLLVDADVAKPHVSSLFGVSKEPGLIDVLSDTSRSIDAGLEATVVGTDVPCLSLLPAGQRSETAAELMASGRMREVVQRLAARYPQHIILFDSSPILLTSEARVLASLVGQVVIVVAADKTPQQALKDAVQLVDGAKKLSLILNQAELNGPSGYYYGYAYGYGSQPGSAASQAQPK